jgi:A/G-specific adenine glycosylase
VPVLDINIKRVLMHSFDLPKEISVFDLQTIALSMVPIGKSREWHNALMDYGSAVLHSKAT